MKLPSIILIFSLMLRISLFADQSGVAYVYQVSDGLALEEPQMARVYCHDDHANSGIPPFALVSAPNIPPTNATRPVEDHNLVSASKIVISVTADEPWVVTIDATKASVPERFDITLPELLKLTKDAIQKTAKEWNVAKYEIVTKGGGTAQ